MKDEIDILWQLDHPNVVKYHETYEDKNKIYLVMEYCPKNLFDSISDKWDNDASRVFSEKEACNIIQQLLKALPHCNARGIVHRDLKPENIMIGNDGRVRLCDFGVSIKVKTHLLRSNTGTDLFKAPEVLQKQYDQKCDIWSLGCVLYNMITADFAFECTNGFGSMIKQIKRGEYKSLNEGISESLKDLISNMLKVDVD